MSHSKSALRSSSGFSLMEVLTAIVLMGILSAIAASNIMTFQPAYRVRGAALAVAGDMSIARLSAVKEGIVHQFVPLSGGYQIRRQNGVGWTTLKTVVVGNEYPHVEFGFTDVTDDPYGNAIAAAMPGAPVIFHSNGTVQNPSGVFIEAEYDGGLAHQAVSVTAAGRIRVWKYVTEEGEWQ